MTMPCERTRSLRWGWELLCAIASDAEVDESTRAEAVLVAADYPRPALVLLWIAEDASGLPPVAAQSVCAAAELFNKLQAGGQGTQETRTHLRFTQRHFPDAQEARLMGHQSEHCRITEWLLPEDYYENR